MLIGGLQPSSFVDYPGELAAVVFTHGCNLRCGYCHNPQLIGGDPPAAIVPEGVLRWLEQRQGKLGAVVITGGEPTLQPDIQDFCMAVKTLGFQVKLDTNGSRPRMLADLLATHAIDYVAMDLKDELEDYGVLTGTDLDPLLLRESIAIILAADQAHEFRTTVLWPRHDRERLLRMAELLRGGQRWWLQRYRFEGRLDPHFSGTAPDPEWLKEIAAGISASGLPCAVR